MFMKRMILFFAYILMFDLAKGSDLFDIYCIFDGDSCYSLSMIDNDRIQWGTSISRYYKERNTTIDRIPDSVVSRIRMCDTICILENFLYGMGRFYSVDFLTKDSVINVCLANYDDWVNVTFRKLLPWDVNDKTHANVEERVLGNFKHAIDTDMKKVYKWVEESYENIIPAALTMCSIYIKEEKCYRLERFPIWLSWLSFKMMCDYERKWYRNYRCE